MNTLSLKETRIELHTAAQFFEPEEIVTTMGYLNNLLYVVAKKQGAFYKDASNALRVNATKMRSLIVEGIDRLVMPLTHTQDYLGKFWQVPRMDKRRKKNFLVEAVVRKPYLKKIQAKLVELGIFKFTSIDYGENKQRKGTEYEDIDLERALILYEQLEEIYTLHGYTLEDLPNKHKGNAVRILFNWFFGGLGYRRSGDRDAGTAPETRKPWFKMSLKDIADRTHYHGFVPIPRVEPPKIPPEEFDEYLPY